MDALHSLKVLHVDFLEFCGSTLHTFLWTAKVLIENFTAVHLEH